MKKRSIIIVIAVILSLTLLAGCGKSKAVKAAEEAIKAIGEISIDSGDAIASAEKLYNILTDSEKASVSNRLELVEAREAFDNLQGDLVYDNAKQAYEQLNKVADLCANGMDDIYGAWYFGIYKASDTKSYESVYDNMARETPHFSSDELKTAGEMIFSADMTELLMKNDWQYCLYVVEEAITLRGDYDTIDTELNAAQNILQELTKTYDDYSYYPKLKDYFAAVSSYVEFFKSPSGSFTQLSDTINGYENNIRTYRSDVGFLFNR